MNDAITINVKQCCDDLIHRFIKRMGVDGRLRRTRRHIGCRPPEDEATFRVKGNSLQQ